MWSLLLVFLAGIGAGFVNATAGGGAILTLPALYVAGLPIDVANATHRFAIIFQCITAVIEFKRKNIFKMKDTLPFLAPTVLGSIGGSIIIINIDKKLLQIITAIFILIMGLLLAFKPKLWEEKRTITIATWWKWIVFLIIGFYGGFIHVGVGFPIVFALTTMVGYDLLTSNAIKSAIILVYVITNMIIFISHGIVDFPTGILLAISTSLGAYIGARLATAKGSKFLRYIVLATVILSFVKMVYDVIA